MTNFIFFSDENALEELLFSKNDPQNKRSSSSGAFEMFMLLCI